MLIRQAVNQTRISLFDAIPRSAFVEARRLFHKVNRPLLLGEVSLEIGWSLERTQQVIGWLIGQGQLRLGTEEECQALGYHPTAELLVLEEPRQLALAHR